MDSAATSHLQSIYEESRMVGWDFSRLDGRLVSDDPWWNFDADCLVSMSQSARTVDLGTGGGEWLRTLLDRAEGTSGVVDATEGWGPNLAVARENLRPYGVDVCRYDAETGESMPFRDESVDLIMARHESIDPAEVARVLSRGGRLLTQQVDGRDAPEIHDWFTGAFVHPQVTSERFVANLEAEGMRVDVVDDWQGTMEFTDIESLVIYLALVPWDAPNFSVQKWPERLESLGEDLPIRVTQRRFRIYATKL